MTRPSSAIMRLAHAELLRAALELLAQRDHMGAIRFLALARQIKDAGVLVD